MILDKKESNGTALTDAQGNQVLVGNPVNSDYVLKEKHGYEACYVLYDKVRVSVGVLASDFEVVENYCSVDFVKSTGIFQPYYFVYKHKEHDYYITLAREGYMEELLENEYDDIIPVGGGFRKVSSIYYKAGSPTLPNVVESIQKTLDVNYESSSKICVILKGASGFIFKEVDIKPLEVDVDMMYNDDFKPVYNHIIDNLERGDKGSIFLYGDAGTGKTNFIRHLTTVLPSKKFVFIPSSIAMCLADPDFLSELIENKGSILVLEDCESFIRDRKMVETGGVVSSILNITDGMLSDVLGVKIICTFNSKITDVDPALMRRGRMIARYEFKPLEREKAKKLADSLGSTIDLDKESATLSNIFNSAPPSSEVTKQNKIGF